MASSKSFDRIITGTSSGSVHLYDITSGLSKLKTPKCLESLSGSVIGVKYASSSLESVLVSTTESVLMVDLRSDEIVHTFSGELIMLPDEKTQCPEVDTNDFKFADDRESVRKKPFNTFDINNNDRIVCAGTEQGDNEAYLLFFDVRKKALLGAYWDRLSSKRVFISKEFFLRKF